VSDLVVAAVFVAVVVALFAAAVRVGMLLGVRLDRSLEARRSGPTREEEPFE
jgi:hypothetical protein